MTKIHSIIFITTILLTSIIAISSIDTAYAVTETAKLTASDAAAADLFGRSVSISGDTILVGSFADDLGSGSAYVFEKINDVWTETAKLTASDAAAFDLFGSSVSISVDTILVGSHYDDDAGSLSGSAYVFTRTGTTWTQTAKLTASDAAAGDQFGSSVSISGDTILVGSHYDDDVASNSGSNSGSAYVFTRTGTTWTQTAKLTASDAAIGDQFGRSVSISGDTILVGSHYDDDVASNSGSAYVFEIFTNSDSTPPVISILGENPVSTIEGLEYIDAGATALDDVDGDLTNNITVDNAVGTSIPDTYLVTYSVSDEAGNTAEASRTVIIQSIEDAIQDLINDVESLELPTGTENQLINNLNSAISILSDNNEKNDAAACGKLDSFVNKVEAQSGKKIDSVDADSLIESAHKIKTALGC